MKLFAHWGTQITLMTTVLIGTLGMSTPPSLALPEEEVLQKLAPVIIFMVTNNEGAPVIVSVPVEGDEPAEVAGAFMSRSDAESLATQLRQESPNIADQVQITPTSLAEVYQLEFANEGQDNDIDFVFIPVQEQVVNAGDLLGGDELRGVPLFVARGGPNRGYLTIEQENRPQAVPFYFEYEQAQALADRFKAANPELADTVVIQVLLLEGIINTLRTEDDPQLSNIVLVPSQESLGYLQQIRQQQQQ